MHKTLPAPQGERQRHYQGQRKDFGAGAAAIWTRAQKPNVISRSSHVGHWARFEIIPRPRLEGADGQIKRLLARTPCRRLGTIIGTQAAQDILHVILNVFFRTADNFRDFPIGFTHLHPLEYFFLACGH